MMLPFPHECEIPLALHCTLGIGGPARFLAEAKDSEALLTMVGFARKAGLPYIVLGKGSNVLFDDRGFAGLVILNRLDHVHQDGGIFIVGAGHSFAHLGTLSARGHWTGLEFAAGIPASVGGAIFMNAGANGQETKDCLLWVKYIDKTGALVKAKKEELFFGYRTSCFHTIEGTIVEAAFQLAENIEARNTQRKLLSHRFKTQPYREKSAGSVFRNPQGSSAGRIIEEVGLKGFSYGGAAVSELHANFVVNRSGATSSDFLVLLEQIKERVYKERGIQLEQEIRIIPYDGRL